MNLALEKIQQNISLNAFKDAANKLAFLNIGIAIFILLLKPFTQLNLSFYYQLAMIPTAILMLVYITDVLLGQKRESLRIAVIFVSFMVIYPFLNNMLMMPAYPVFAAVVSILLGNLFKNFNEDLFKNGEKTPIAVTAYFNQLIPIVLILASGFGIAWGLNQYFDTIMNLYLALLSIMSHYITLAIVIILICSFWYLGLHGVTVISTLMRPFWFQMVLFNAYYYICGEAIAFIGTETFLQWFVWLGGSGSTLGLSISLRFLARSQALKDLGQVAFRSNVHNINESIIFGVPISENKIFRIPFFLAPLVLSACGYAAIHWGFIPNFALVMPWVLPIPLGALLSSGGSIKAMGFSLLMILLSWLIYYPFFKKYDNQLLKEERVASNEG